MWKQSSIDPILFCCQLWHTCARQCRLHGLRRYSSVAFHSPMASTAVVPPSGFDPSESLWCMQLLSMPLHAKPILWIHGRRNSKYHNAPHHRQQQLKQIRLGMWLLSMLAKTTSTSQASAINSLDRRELLVLIRTPKLPQPLTLIVRSYSNVPSWFAQQ